MKDLSLHNTLEWLIWSYCFYSTYDWHIAYELANGRTKRKMLRQRDRFIKQACPSVVSERPSV